MKVSRKDFKKISDWLWKIPKSFRNDMKVPAQVFASEKTLEEMFKDRTLEQLVNSTTFPGIVRSAFVMPDAHEGYGVPIGFVGGMKTSDGVISPGALGFDINCGIRILKSNWQEKDIKPYLEKLALEIQNQVPSGLGRGRKIKLSVEQINRILEGGAKYLVEKGYGEKEDGENCESKGRLDWADSSCISEKAKNRGRDQVGTLGSGNHFLEIQKVEKIFDKEIAERFDLFENQIVVMIHSGSRGTGHQICTDYLKIMLRAMEKYKIKVAERDLACTFFNSPEGQSYFKAMAGGANFAWANRQMISFYLRKAWQKILGEKEKLILLYDVAHNIGKIENYKIDGKETELIIHRKGATRAFPPNHPELPERYKNTGQPVLIPGSMGTASWILAGIEEGELAFYSTCHGAGRRMSRKAATRTVTGQQVVKELEKKGIIVKCHSMRGIAEEAPIAYKNVDEVIEVVDKAKLSKKVAKLIPIAVIKGE